MDDGGWNNICTNDNETIPIIGLNECAIIGAVLLQYILFFILAVIMITRYCRKRRRKRRRSTTFNLSQDTGTTANCGFQSSSPTTGDAEKNHPQKKDRRISGDTLGYSVVKMIIDSYEPHNQQQQSDTYSKLRGEPQLSEYSHLQSNVRLQEALPSSPPPLPNQPPPRSKPRSISTIQKTDEVIAVQVEAQIIQATMHGGVNNTDNSNACDPDSVQENSVHYYKISRSNSSDIYSLANNSETNEFPAEYEDFYSTADRDKIDEANSLSDDENKHIKGNIEMKEVRLEKKRDPVPLPVPLPASVNSRSRSVSNVEQTRFDERRPNPSGITTASFRKTKNPHIYVNM